MISAKNFFHTPRGIFALLLTAGILLRAEYLREFSASPLFGFALGADVSEYWARAQGFLNGSWTTAPPDIHAPLYSLFLAAECFLTGSSIPLIRGIQLLLGVLVWVFFYFFLRKKICPPESRMPEWIFAGAMLYIPMIFFQAELVSESLLLLLLPLLVCCMMQLDLRPENDRKSLFTAAAGGALAGLAILTHPMTLLYWALQSLVLILQKHRLRALLFAGTAVALILPVSICRSLEAGRPVLVQSNSAFNLYLGNHAGSDGTCSLRPGAAWKEFHRQARLLAEERNCPQDRIHLENTLAFFRQEPLQAAALLLKKALLVWTTEELPAGADAPPVYGWTPLIRFGAPFARALLLGLALAGLYPVLADEKLRKRWLVLLLLTGAFYGAQILFVTSGRYRLAMIPGLIVLAAAFVQWHPRKYQEKILSAAGASLLLLWASLLTPSIRGVAESRTLFAEALYRQGRPEAVKFLLRDTVENSNDPARDMCLLGMAEAMTGNRQEAERLFQMAAQAAPAEAEGLMNLGILRSEAGRPAEAEKLLLQARQREPDHAGTLYNLALVLEKMKRYPEAEKELQTLLRLSPADARAWNALGRVQFCRRDLAGAEKAFRRALSLNPRSPGLKRNLEIVLKENQSR